MGRMTESRPQELGPVLWFALGALVLALVFVVAQVPVAGFVALVLAVFWGAMGLIRLRRIHRYVQERQK